MLVVSVLSGCNLLGETELQESFTTYVNEDLSRIGELEEEAIGTLNSVSGANYTDDPTFARALEEDIIPPYEEAIQLLKEIELESEEIRSLHETYIEGAELQLEAFHQALEALETQNMEMMEQSNEMLTKGSEKIGEYTTGMKELAEENNIEYTEPSLGQRDR